MPELADYDKFKHWLRRRGRDVDTADLYITHLKGAFNEGYLERLLDDTLSPYTRRTILAALRAWAKFTKNDELVAELNDIKLPPARRRTVRIPLEKDDWHRLLTAIGKSQPSPMIAVIGMMATRGFRVGDVLRMTRNDIKDAIDTDTLAFKAKGGRQLEFGVATSYKPFLEMLLEAGKHWKLVADLISAPGENQAKRARLRVYRALQTLALKAKLDPDTIYPHRLRRTIATRFLEKVKGDLVKLKEWMGWTNINTAAAYVDFVKRSELDAIAETLFD